MCDLDILGFLAGETASFFSHVQSSLAFYKATQRVPSSAFAGDAGTTPGVSVKREAKVQKVKRTRAPSAYNHYVQMKLAEMQKDNPNGPKGRMTDAAASWKSMSAEERAKWNEDFKAAKAETVTRADGEGGPAMPSLSAPAATGLDLQSPVSNGTGGMEVSKKKKKRKDQDGELADGEGATVGGEALPVTEDGERKKKKKKKKHSEAGVAGEEAF